MLQLHLRIFPESLFQLNVSIAKQELTTKGIVKNKPKKKLSSRGEYKVTKVKIIVGI
jgi:hypothetical protein